MRLGSNAAVAWLILFVVMLANGAVRVVLLQPRLGEAHARQLASLSGVAIVLLVSWVFVRASGGATEAQLLRTGIAWVGGMLAFEFLFGHFVSGLSWGALLADYNLARGRLWSLVVLSALLGPWLCGVVGGGAK
jgi:hypothetical protein